MVKMEINTQGNLPPGEGLEEIQQPRMTWKVQAHFPPGIITYNIPNHISQHVDCILCIAFIKWTVNEKTHNELNNIRFYNEPWLLFRASFYRPQRRQQKLLRTPLLSDA